MKTVFSIAVLAVLLITPNRSFALWSIANISKEQAKELGLEVRSTAAKGSNKVLIELEFKTEGTFKGFSPGDQDIERSGVEVWIGQGDQSTKSSTLRADQSKPGSVAFHFTANHRQLDKFKLRVLAPDLDGGSIFELRVKDFVEGDGVVINSGSEKEGAVPASPDSMFVIAALGAMLLIPGLIFLAVRITRSKPLVEEIGSHLASPASRNTDGK